MTQTTRIVIKVPKRLQGKVIGKGAATLRDIESDYPGVKVTVPQRDDPSEDVVVEGPRDAAERAHARILDICEMAPDPSGGLRAEAQKLYKEMEALFEKSRNAESREEKVRLKDLAHKKRQEAEAKQKEAALRVFATKNSGYGDDQMDLHGLFVSEAVEFVRERLVAVDGDLRSGTLETLTIITGAGHHSDGNVAKIKPEIEKLLGEGGYPFEEDDSGGMFLVSFKGVEPALTPGEPQPAPATTAPAVTTTAPAATTTTPAATTTTPAAGEGAKKEEESGWHVFAAVAVALCSCLVAVCSSKKDPAPEEASAGRENGAQPREQEMSRLAQA